MRSVHVEKAVKVRLEREIHKVRFGKEKCFWPTKSVETSRANLVNSITIKPDHMKLVPGATFNGNFLGVSLRLICISKGLKLCCFR